MLISVICRLWLTVTAAAFSHNERVATRRQAVGETSVECIRQESGETIVIYCSSPVDWFVKQDKCNYVKRSRCDIAYNHEKEVEIET